MVKELLPKRQTVKGLWRFRYPPGGSRIVSKKKKITEKEKIC